MFNSPNTALHLELDGNPDQMSARGTATQVFYLKKKLIIAKQDAASPRGKLLRETGLIRITIGTTGRLLAFGQPDPNATEIEKASMWRSTITDALDGLSLIIRFGYFMADMEEITALQGGEQFHAKEKMVRAVAASGGLSWETQKLHPSKTVSKVFREWKAYTEEFHAWEQEIAKFDETAEQAEADRREQALKRNQEAKAIAEAAQREKEATAAAEKLPTVNEVVAELAATIEGSIGIPPRAETVQQEQRLDAIGAPNVVPVSAPSMEQMQQDTEDISKLLSGLSKGALSRLQSALDARKVDVAQSELAAHTPADSYRVQK